MATLAERQDMYSHTNLILNKEKKIKTEKNILKRRIFTILMPENINVLI